MLYAKRICVSKMHKHTKKWYVPCLSVVVCLFFSFFLLFGYLDFDRFDLLFIEQYRSHIQSCLANITITCSQFRNAQKNEIVNSTIFFLLQQYLYDSHKKKCYGNKKSFLFFLLTKLRFRNWSLCVYRLFFFCLVWHKFAHSKCWAKKNAVINFCSFSFKSSRLTVDTDGFMLTVDILFLTVCFFLLLLFLFIYLFDCLLSFSDCCWNCLYQWCIGFAANSFTQFM